MLQSFGLNAQPLSHVCLMVADIFTYYQNAQLKFLQVLETNDDDSLFFGEHRIQKDDTFLCAVINNSTICQEHMDELKDKILDRLREAEGIAEATPLPTVSSNNLNNNSGSNQPKTLLEQMEDTFEECGEGFVSVSSEATDLLVLQISLTLQKPIGNLFSPAWLKDEAVTHDIVLTLKDFATDYRVSSLTIHACSAKGLRVSDGRA